MAPELDKAERQSIELALLRLNADFCYYLDHRDTDKLVDLFTEHAIYTHNRRESRGRGEILALFERRNAPGVRTSRHLQTGLRIDVADAETASGMSVCMTVVADQAPPIPHTMPHLIADFNDAYHRCEDGRWRISRRHIERIFLAPGNKGPVGTV